MHAKLQARRDLSQRLCGTLAAGRAVGDDANMMAAIGLAIGEVEDVTKMPPTGARTACRIRSGSLSTGMVKAGAR